MIKIMFYLEMEGTKMGKRIWINKQYILKNAANYTKNIYSVLGFLGTFFTVTEIFNPEPRVKHIDEETGEEYYSGYLYFKYTIETDETTGQ